MKLDWVAVVLHLDIVGHILGRALLHGVNNSGFGAKDIGLHPAPAPAHIWDLGQSTKLLFLDFSRKYEVRGLLSSFYGLKNKPFQIKGFFHILLLSSFLAGDRKE